jgi:transcriptional regulator with XRE-family HTH domain
MKTPSRPADTTDETDVPSRRATAAQQRGPARAVSVAGRVGTGLREARLARGRTQASVAWEAGISQPFLSRIERGRELGVSLVALTACASALEVQLAAFIEAMPGASLPRDIQHLRRQALVVRIAEPGGWTAEPEAALPGDGPWPRSIDVLLIRAIRREVAVVEIWDLLADGGEAMRGLEAKVLATRRRLGPEWQVQGLLVLRATRRNRSLVRDLAPLFAARYPASSAGWLRALADPRSPMPGAPGFAWSSVAGDRLAAARLR